MMINIGGSAGAGAGHRLRIRFKLPPLGRHELVVMLPVDPGSAHHALVVAPRENHIGSACRLAGCLGLGRGAAVTAAAGSAGGDSGPRDSQTRPIGARTMRPAISPTQNGRSQARPAAFIAPKRARNVLCVLSSRMRALTGLFSAGSGR